MHSSGSFIYSVLEWIRVQTDEPSNAKYSDDLLVRQFIGAAWAETVGLLKMTDDNPILLRLSFTFVSGTEWYIIPSWVEEVWRLGKRDTMGNVTHDWFPRHQADPSGVGWQLEGNMLRFNPIPQSAETWELLVVPSGDVCLHYATAGKVISPTVIELAATPTVGLLDRRPNAYAGQVLRTLSAGRTWQERIIETYDPSTRRATVRVAFTQDASNLPADDAALVYEIAPLGQRSLWMALGWKVCMKIGAARNFTQKQMTFLQVEYDRALKAIRDRLGNMNVRTGKAFARDTEDRGDLYAFDAWVFGGM